ncbi:MAG TPA: YdcF family protein [Pyrinomonadaceae bacterium]
MKLPPGLGNQILRGVLITVIVAWSLSAASVLLWGARDRARPSDAIVVLGAAQYVGRPSPVLRARLDHALDLWQRGLAPRLIFTGGTGVGDTTSEAAVSRIYALKHGVPDTAILMENEGRTTRESLAAVSAIMHARQMRTAILVSDPFHMLRLRILSTQYGVDAYTSPTKTSPISANKAQALAYVLSESIKVPMMIVAHTFALDEP